jgi:hypothetical protein
MRWKIFFSDGSTWTDRDGPAEKAPGWGVLVITQADERVGRALVRESDFYIFSPAWFGGWEGVDLVGLLDYLAHSGEPATVKLGRTVSPQVWNDALIRASDDDYCPRKSASRRHEPRPRGATIG